MSIELWYIIQKMCKQLAQSPDCVRTTPIRHGSTNRNNVWKLEMSGQLFLLKEQLIPHALEEHVFSASQVEFFVLSTLHDAGCNVPRIVWKSHTDSFLLLEWVGVSTLDDLAQTESYQSLSKVTTNALKTFCKIEQTFASKSHILSPYVYPLDYPKFLRSTMQTMINQGRKTLGYLSHLSRTRTSTTREIELDTLWLNLSERLHLNKPTLGALDYNARNVVLDGEEPSFVDFARIGWDWSERRIIQLFNSLGSNRNTGNFVNLLDHVIVKSYTEQAVTYRNGCSEKDIAAQLDYHNILFYLATVHRLLTAVVRPDTTEGRQLLSTWKNADARLARALDVLEHSRLSDDAHAHKFRTLISEFREES